MSALANWQQSLWALNVGAEVGLCYFIVCRRAYKYLPFFFFYLASVLAQSAVMFASYRLWGFSSWTSYIVFWATRAVVVLARGMAVAEICKNSLYNYHGIWRLGRHILAGVGALVLLYAGLAALAVRHNTLRLALARTVLAADRGLELALVAVLLSLLIFARYYRVALNLPHKALAVGFCFFSCVVILNDTILSVLLKQYASVWNGIELSSYFVVLVAWCRAVYKLAPVPSRIPALLPQTIYDELSPQFNLRLRLLNDRLLGMLKP